MERPSYPCRQGMQRAPQPQECEGGVEAAAAEGALATSGEMARAAPKDVAPDGVRADRIAVLSQLERPGADLEKVFANMV